VAISIYAFTTFIAFIHNQREDFTKPLQVAILIYAFITFIAFIHNQGGWPYNIEYACGWKTPIILFETNDDGHNDVVL
jgi:hypothetical protein